MGFITEKKNGMLAGKKPTGGTFMGKKAAARMLSGFLAAAAVFQALIPAGISRAEDTGVAANAGSSPALISEDNITSGAVLRKYVWNSARSGKPVATYANVVVVDLQNPNVKLDVMTGKGNKLNTYNTVLGMAKENKAVAAINGSFFNTSVITPPIGHEIAHGEYIATTLDPDGWYSFGITKDNKPVIDQYTFQGTVTNDVGVSFELAGINKAPQWNNGTHSHTDKIYMYTKAWGKLDRANDTATVPTEMLVQNGVIQKIAYKSKLNMLVPDDGYILRASGAGAEYVHNFLQEGQNVYVDYQMKALDPANTEDAKAFKMMIGGQTILVKDGAPAAFSTDVKGIAGYRSRTGVGYSQDRRYVYLITVDHSGDSSDGMTMTEFQKFMLQIGVWKGMNLDGGGSTALVSRPLGDTLPVVANQLEFGTQRSIANSLGVFSLAPAGNFAGLKLAGNSVLFLGEKASFSAKPYDEYYNPLSAGDYKVNWSEAKGNGTFAGNVFTPSKLGKTTITVTSGIIRDSMDVEVVGRDQIGSMKIDAPVSTVTEGASYRVPVVVTTKSGATRTVPSNLIQWQFVGFEGTAQNGSVQVNRLTGGTAGLFIARYDGFSAVLAMPVGSSKVMADFDKMTMPVAFSGYPSSVTGAVNTVADSTDGNDNVLSLKYNFTGDPDTKAAYAQFNGAKGAAIAGSPIQMRLKARGDRGLNALKAEVTDSKGQLKRIDLSGSINWTGWKTLNVDLTPYKLSYPITLKSIYVLNPEQDQDERQSVGEIALDDISFVYAGKITEPVRPVIKLAIGQKTMNVNGKAVVMDQAPVIRNQSTLVPVKFIAETLNGRADWYEPERKVTVLRGTNLLDMWIGNPQLIMNGNRVVSRVAPCIINRRTMVPLKVISEQLGWKVTWDGAARSIILE